MKSSILALSLVLLVSASPAQAVVPLLAPIVSGATKAIAGPIFQGFMNQVSAAMGASCSALCKAGTFCGGTKADEDAKGLKKLAANIASAPRSKCKDSCTTRMPVGGYTIRIRYGLDGSKRWSLFQCVKKGVTAGDDPLGKNETKSIAIYSEEDIKSLLMLLAERDAAIRVTNLPKSTDTEKAQAKKDIVALENAIEQNRKANLYGPQ
jgi:hypothetical protein